MTPETKMMPKIEHQKGKIRPCTTSRKHRESPQEWRFRANLGGRFGGRGSGICGISESVKKAAIPFDDLWQAEQRSCRD